MARNFLENQISDENKSDAATDSVYKEIATPYNNSNNCCFRETELSAYEDQNLDQNEIALKELTKENQELIFINEMLNSEVDKLNKQLELLERKNVILF